MEARSEVRESVGGRGARRGAGRILGAVGVLLAVAGIFIAFSISGVSIFAGTLGIVLGVAGYLLGSRSFGGAAIVCCLATLFVGLSVSQHLF